MNKRQQRKCVARVNRGAKLLDSAHPGWFKRVKVKELDMSSPCKCVLGQLYQDSEAYDDGYEAGCALLVGGMFARIAGKRDQLSAVYHGFDHEDADDDEYELLALLWESQIAARK